MTTTCFTHGWRTVGDIGVVPILSNSTRKANSFWSISGHFSTRGIPPWTGVVSSYTSTASSYATLGETSYRLGDSELSLDGVEAAWARPLEGATPCLFTSGSALCSPSPVKHSPSGWYRYLNSWHFMFCFLCVCSRHLQEMNEWSNTNLDYHTSIGIK